ncbi:hypothetical protein B0H66DRAFT_468915 [Apodospora peruviana]|uniref:threonine--tRNA ligase n=1 Tax=Apodospora peruviana TaxID=516989 RepID=A0AAE0ISA1_9PEZI|nr:hypothetical protein B0H66DRAFT_468915 [Apodospora peruviana]
MKQVRRPRALSSLQVQLQSRLCSYCEPPSTSTSNTSAVATAIPSFSPLPKPNADHRDIGLQQELFTTSIYSPGSPILLPNGARIFNRLVDFLRKQYVHYGFQEVITPTIYKKSLWAKSGHLENYAEDMYTVTSTSPVRADSNQENSGEDEYGLKPMNCPGHCLVFASQKRSYRELPIRYADFSPLHRNEISGALSGLTRVRRFHQDDGHIFCRPSQIEDEIRKTLDFIRVAYSVFRLGPYRLALSTRPLEHYIGSLQDWEQAESSLTRALDACGQSWTLNEGDGAFYGPKIDVILKDSDGKEHQTATIQLDFQLPKRFELEYQAPAPEAEQRGETTTDADALGVFGSVRPVLIHRAVLGSVERLMALLIEHYNGKWPFWLNARQAIILTVNDKPPVVEWARRAQQVLLGLPCDGDSSSGGPVAPSQLAIDFDDRAMALGAKIREAKKKGYGMIVVVGEVDAANRTVTVDATGVPPVEGEEPVGKGMKMTPEELLDFMRSKQPKMDLTAPSEQPPDYIAAARAHGINLRQSAPIRRGPMALELPILTYLKAPERRVILASASPRRKALLSQLGLSSIEIFPSTKAEDIDKATHTPEEYVSATARQKCLHVYETALEEQEEAAKAKGDNDAAVPQDPALVIAADTVIATRAGKILEKPRNEADHVRILKHLRDTRVHRVLTSVCVLAPKADASHPGYEIAAHTEETKVFFAQANDGLPDDVIENYVRTREGADKAGGYAVQGIGGMLLVERVEGSVDNVIGLPVRKCLQLCEKVVFKQGEEEFAESDDGGED